VFEENVVYRAAFVVAMMLALGCHAQTKANAQMSAGTESDDRKYETAETELPPPAPRAAALADGGAVAETPSDRLHFLGVVHDLMLAPAAQRTAACQCLAVGYGPPSDPKFVWHVGAPRTDPGTIALAVAADGVACSARGYAPLLASISAVQNDGDDLVLTMENVRDGAPVVHGALVVPPAPGGALVIRARRGAPYGAPLAGRSGPCRLKMQ
jgi:hypothetical protein